MKMHPLFKDITGQTFGRLTPIQYIGHQRWLCQCFCGTRLQIEGAKLRNGHSRSCGCLRLEQTKKTGKANRQHGLSKSAEHYIWDSMLQRCNNPAHKSYKEYGARGIKVCVEWEASFETFYSDMGPRPSKDYQLDRINNNLGYFKDNCRWTTRTEQARNRRSTRFITFKGETLIASEWATRLRISQTQLAWRLKKWPVEQALTQPVRVTK